MTLTRNLVAIAIIYRWLQCPAAGIWWPLNYLKKRFRQDSRQRRRNE
jgi:hypothetical protein